MQNASAGREARSLRSRLTRRILSRPRIGGSGAAQFEADRAPGRRAALFPSEARAAAAAHRTAPALGPSRAEKAFRASIRRICTDVRHRTAIPALTFNSEPEHLYPAACEPFMEKGWRPSG